MSSILDQLRDFSTVVADTGDLQAIRDYRPTDCTTNPSIVLAALGSAEFAPIVEQALRGAQGRDLADLAFDLTVRVGVELARLIPGRVSTEVDAALSFDTPASLRQARRIVDAYATHGIGRERILIKLASTWEGIQAARVLQDEGIDCNLTLLFSMAQARACADAGVFLISPFVGRITDWHKARSGQDYPPETDPGVQSVRAIYRHYKENGIPTVVMGASFRNIGQIEALAGCDRLTIAPALLKDLAAAQGTLPRALVDGGATGKAAPISEAEFRWQMNEDEMASDKLAEGIRKFHADALKLDALLAQRLAALAGA